MSYQMTAWEQLLQLAQQEKEWREQKEQQEQMEDIRRTIAIFKQEWKVWMENGGKERVQQIIEEQQVKMQLWRQQEGESEETEEYFSEED
jgi:hypothetical protein